MSRMDLKRDVRLGSKEGALLFMALVIIFYTIARLLSVGMHEVLGHGLFAEAVGGEFYATYISPSGGFAAIHMPAGTAAWVTGIIYMAGIMVELVVGLVILFLVLPRMKTFTKSLFMIVLAEVMLVHSSLYIVLGTMIPEGDTYIAAWLFGIPKGFFVIVGLVLSCLFVQIISLKVIDFISAHMIIRDDKAARKGLILFWLPPLAVIWSSFLIPSGASAAEMKYAFYYGVLLLLLTLLSIFFISRIFTLKFRISDERGPRLDRVTAALAIFVVALVIWMVVFGPSRSAAHGLLLKDPPVEIEQSYTNYSVGNIVIFIDANGTLDVSVRLKGVVSDRSSPLDRKIYESFDNRPNWPYFEDSARVTVANMFGLNESQAENITFETSVGGGVWAVETYGYARNLDTTLNFSFVGFSFESNGYLALEINDPWMVGSNPGYIDGIEFRWGNLTFLNYTAQNYTGHNISYHYGNVSQSFIGWQNPDIWTSPTSYTILLRTPQYK